MRYRHYSVRFVDGSNSGAYAAGPQDALEQVYAEDPNGNQPEVAIIWLTEAFGPYFDKRVDESQTLEAEK